MVSQPPTDTPFGLQANVAAGLAYLFIWVGGLVMLLGGGTNTFVKWAAAQSITLSICAFVVFVAFGFLSTILTLMLHLFFIMYPLYMLLNLLCLVIWLWTTIFAFQGKEVRIPIVADLTQKIFASMLV